jgi:hypothetical protein
MEKLRIERFRSGPDFTLKYKQHPDITAMLFQQFVATALIPLIEELRKNDEFTREPAI